MGVRERIQKYREIGGASDMVRVEVLVPEKFRSEVLAQAAMLRSLHREKNARLQRQIDWALRHYSVRIKDNLDLDRISDIAEKSRLVAKALMERGDARAFAAGRKMLDEVDS
jgi:hypothetical protein